MSAAARRDQVLADLDTILSGPASRTGIATAPYLSNRNGLCQRDVIYLDYDREQEGASNDRFVPVGIGPVFREFHFLGFESGPREGWKEACQGLADKDVYWARSDDDSTASSALANLALAVADVSEGNVSIDCTELDDIENEAECASEFLAAAPNVSRVYECDIQPEGLPSDCFHFEMGQYDVTIVKIFSRFAGVRRSFAIEMKYAPIILT